ncbi:unnamed protein product [Moneuplotes crassus]|uniref:Uncharacterized protein n=1 Tax=Euplotes crassus TaxID=5936 RepID=A0AAD1X8A8_EUPCR|nr:unnamed protein product [Moneuplotes crassus]
MNKHSFLKNDKLTEEGKIACSVLQIDPILLQVKTKDSFKTEGVSDKVAETRHYHYEMKRKQLLEEIHEYLKDVSSRGSNKAFMRSKFVDHEIKKARISSQGNSPYHSRTKPDIPLRVPLDEEARKKREMAKDILGQELNKLVTQNKMGHTTNLNRTTKLSSPKHIPRIPKRNEKELQKQKDKRDQAKFRAEEETRKRESIIYKNFKKKEKRRTESMQKKINDTIKQQKRIYENDQKHYQEIQSMSMTRKMEEDKKVQIELEKFDKKMKKFELNRQRYQQEQARSKERRNLMSPSSNLGSATQQTTKGRHKIEQLSEDEINFRLRLEKTFKNQLEHKEKREKHLLNMRRMHQAKLAKDNERFNMNIRQRDLDLQHKNKLLMKRIKEKAKIGSHKHQDDEYEVKRENVRLRRENQMINYKREMALENNYKAQLIDQLLEKKERAAKARERSKTAGIPNSLNLSGI